MSLLSVGALNRKPLQDASNSRIVRRTQIVSLQRAAIEKAVIVKFTGCSPSTVSRWAICENNDGLGDKARTGRPAMFDDKTQLSLIGFYCQTSPVLDCGRWTMRWAEKHLIAHREILGASISRSSIHRILKKHQLKPHLKKYFLQITDPDFFPKMEHLLELYATPPEHLFFFDECPGIQILTRTAPDMTTEEKKRWLVEFEYNRNGTIDVLAFLEHKTGKVFAKCTYDHKSETFASVFESHVKSKPPKVRLDYVMDNLSTHCNE